METAIKIFSEKVDFPDGCVLQGIVWRLPKSVPGSQHFYKYRLYYGCEGRRDIGYDNERGKGDHKHYGDRQEPYTFSTYEQLLEDFITDVQSLRAGGQP